MFLTLGVQVQLCYCSCFDFILNILYFFVVLLLLSVLLLNTCFCWLYPFANPFHIFLALVFNVVLLVVFLVYNTRLQEAYPASGILVHLIQYQFSHQSQHIILAFSSVNTWLHMWHVNASGWSALFVSSCFRSLVLCFVLSGLLSFGSLVSRVLGL